MRLASNKRYGRALSDAWKFGVGPLRNRKGDSRRCFEAISEASLQMRDDEWREFENEHRSSMERKRDS